MSGFYTKVYYWICRDTEKCELIIKGEAETKTLAIWELIDYVNKHNLKKDDVILGLDIE
jgi:hypothetical protein